MTGNLAGRRTCNLCGQPLSAADAMRTPGLCRTCRPDRPGICASCGANLSTPAARESGFCGPCGETVLMAEPGPERVTAVESARTLAKAGGRDSIRTLALERCERIAGRPWWESEESHFVATYTDVSLMNAEAQMAGPFGWFIAETTGIGGHVSVGKVAMGAFLAGLPGMALGARRSADKITATWRRDPASPATAVADPVASLRHLKSMLDEALISEEEFATKKAELLARM